MNDLIVFTHVPKTSGTSLIKELAEQNLSSSHIYKTGRLIKAIPAMQKDYKLLWGHLSYGLHLFTKKEVKYITFLREPIDRAISFYFFVKQWDGVNKSTIHPLRDYAESVTLKEFYENRKFHNHQTRFMAGYIIHKLYPFISSPLVKKIILKKAIHNLKNYYFYFGIVEERENSLALFQKKFGWKAKVEIPRQQKTHKRLQVTEIDNETLQTLKQANDLDLQLYDFALNYFQQQN